MPVNRRAQPEAEKRAQLIAAAQKLFIREGYEATSMSRIAKAARVTPNTIYWYFKDKDALLVAVLDEMFRASRPEYQKAASLALPERYVWLVERLRKISGLIATVHNRIHESEALAQWHAGFHAKVAEYFRAGYRLKTPGGNLDAEARIIAYTIEGLVTHDLDAAATRRTCEALAARWSPPTER
jgi:AcrR family transcriptional regulator